MKNMRREKQALTLEECTQILQEENYGVLGFIGGEYPYTVPLNYVYSQGKLWFHSALEGHKITCMEDHPKVSFSVVALDKVVAEEFTTKYKSVHVLGEAFIHKTEEEKKKALRIIMNHLSGEFSEEGERRLNSRLHALHTFEIDIDKIAGKASLSVIEKMRE